MGVDEGSQDLQGLKKKGYMQDGAHNVNVIWQLNH